jgi:hypothetical protein
MPRQNTRLEAQGAEFLVLGQLLVERLQAYKMYVNMPGYDVLVVNPEVKPQRVARVSVKSRWRASAQGLIINNFESDFVVVVKLNRGTKPLPVEYFITPTEKLSVLKKSNWGKINFSAIPDFQSYMDKWCLIHRFVDAHDPTEPNDKKSIEL